jgi:leucyl/phenylalanyl-tRNA--protein transferase
VRSTTSMDDDVTEAPPAAANRNPRFTETLAQRLRRWVLGCGYALVPKRIGLLPRLLVLSVAHLLAPEAVRERLPEQPHYYSKRGLVGISNDLSVSALIDKYRRGFFPVCHVGSMKWWCPEERAVINTADTHISKNLRWLLKRENFKVHFRSGLLPVWSKLARRIVPARCRSPGSRRA